MDKDRVRTIATAQPRFTRRLVFMEEPEVAETLERYANESGRSVGAEIRGAIRYWIEAWTNENR